MEVGGSYFRYHHFHCSLKSEITFLKCRWALSSFFCHLDHKTQLFLWIQGVCYNKKRCDYLKISATEQFSNFLNWIKSLLEKAAKKKCNANWRRKSELAGLWCWRVEWWWRNMWHLDILFMKECGIKKNIAEEQEVQNGGTVNENRKQEAEVWKGIEVTGWRQVDGLRRRMYGKWIKMCWRRRKEDKEGIMGDTGKKYLLAEYGTELEGMKWKVEGNSEGDRSVETEICARSLHGRGRELTSWTLLALFSIIYLMTVADLRNNE